ADDWTPPVREPSPPPSPVLLAPRPARGQAARGGAPRAGGGRPAALLGRAAARAAEQQWGARKVGRRRTRGGSGEQEKGRGRRTAFRWRRPRPVEVRGGL